ncbi:hypothetical protein HLB23_33710 [Nocardia uniformis]|uniref:Uncharacterized protein n=1 Tax=Nocardia uniformis TaxID=53432 RepID=A0A849CJM5_9NOCA|nr:hypothetical protein [Nocardia uniformis]NNH74751.1 hypothetical protein [Nocardia uniformis]
MSMGIVISSIAAVTGSGSSIEQAARAAKQAIASAGCGPEQIDALINVGVYRDSNMVEPAMSALIQQQVGIGLEYGSGDVPCLSFDLMNGACGVLNAVQVSQALLESAAVQRVLIVSGDAHPSASAEPVPGFPITPVGAALILEKAEGSVGFGSLHIGATEELPAKVGFVKLREMGGTGRSTVVVDRTDTTVDVLLKHAVESALSAVEVDDIDITRTVLVCGRPTPDFPELLAERLGLPADALCADSTDGDAHTSALPVAYLTARDTGQLDGQQAVLFVAAGAGPTAAAITYRLR